MDRKLKVYAYVTRQHRTGLQVLVFDHIDFPEAGTQVPGGSVEPGEALEAAVLREVMEEAGIDGLTLVREVGVLEVAVPERHQLQERHFFHLTPERELPEEWVHVVSGGTEDQGMRFRYFWLDAGEAVRLLAGQQGCCLPVLLG